jgi:hypothetical protein
MADVNYIGHLTAFYERISEDDRLHSSHVSLYNALFQFWNQNRFENPISISRTDVMRIAKIGSKNTYTKCLKELHEWKYIDYKPSNNPLKGSLIYLPNFGNSSGSTTGSTTGSSSGSGSGSGSGSTGGTLYKHNKHYKQDKHNKHNKQDRGELHSPTQSQTKKNEENLFFDEHNQPNRQSENLKSINKKFTPPTLQEAKDYFHENKSSYQNAEIFFNHFVANGWKVGGKAPMKNWKAAARNWIIRSEQYEYQRMSPAQQRLHVTEHKDYSEPL